MNRKPSISSWLITWQIDGFISFYHWSLTLLKKRHREMSPMTNKSISASEQSVFDSPDCVRWHTSRLLRVGDFLINHQNWLISISELHRADAPTLLHFAAQYGFKSVSSLLLQCPGAEQALHTANRHGQTPAEIAESRGHTELHVLLKETLVTTSIFTVHNS